MRVGALPWAFWGFVLCQHNLLYAGVQRGLAIRHNYFNMSTSYSISQTLQISCYCAQSFQDKDGVTDIRHVRMS